MKVCGLMSTPIFILVLLTAVSTSAAELAPTQQHAECSALQGRAAAFPALRDIIVKSKSLSTPDTQHAAVEALVKRIFPPADAARLLFDVHFNAFPDRAVDTAQISSNGKTVRILGNSGTACAFGLYRFLKDHCGCQVAWSGRQLNLPDVFPTVTKQIVNKADWLHYYQNVCTPSYTSVWWNWTRWEQEIDWMALQGINFPLAFTGQEEIWRRVYAKLELTDDDLNGFFVGPAFLAWGRMGNIRRWDGPLSHHWLNGQLELQHKILKRMVELGMIPILPGFAGMVPEALKRVYPQGKFSRLDAWSTFPDNMTRSYLLDPLDAMYNSLGKNFIMEMIAEYGVVTHFYNTDTFNEQRPNTSDPAFVRNVANATFSAMVDADPDAVWVMQGWLFVSDPDFWTPVMTKALLTAVPLGRMIVLDLDAEIFPIYNSTDSFYGQPFIWCMLHNYGGVQGLYGRLSVINTEPVAARSWNASTMIGVGLAPEGTNQNEVVYEFMNEMGWRTKPVDVNKWMAGYADRRYRKANDDARAAYQILARTVFDHPTTWANHGSYTFTQRPRLDLEEPIWYKPIEVFAAMKHLLDASSDLSGSDMYRYDIVDVGRQCLQITFRSVFERFIQAVNGSDIVKAWIAGNALISTLTDMNHLLASHRQFSLDEWINDAKSWAGSAEEEKQLIQNSLNQITLWGPDANILDYATKQWSGVVSRYYRPRWKLFVHRILESMNASMPFNQTAYDIEVLSKIERPFTMRTYVATPMSKDFSRRDSLKIVRTLWKKYGNFTALGEITASMVSDP